MSHISIVIQQHQDEATYWDLYLRERELLAYQWVKEELYDQRLDEPLHEF